MIELPFWLPLSGDLGIAVALAGLVLVVGLYLNLPSLCKSQLRAVGQCMENLAVHVLANCVSLLNDACDEP